MLAELRLVLARRLGAKRAWVLCAGQAAGILAKLRASVPTEELQETFSLGGVPLRVSDVRAGAREAKAARQTAFKAALKAWGAKRKQLGASGASLEKPTQPGPYILCDNSLATCALCAAAQLGADVVIEDLSLWVGQLAPDAAPHLAGMPTQDKTCTPVAVALSQDALSHWSAGTALATQLDAAQEAFVAAHGMTITQLSQSTHSWDSWAQEASAAAQALASYARCHPGVAQLHYPGLVQDSSYALASGMLHNGFGPYVDLEPAFQPAEQLALALMSSPEFEALRARAWAADSHKRIVRLLVSPNADRDLCQALERELVKRPHS